MPFVADKVATMLTHVLNRCSMAEVMDKTTSNDAKKAKEMMLNDIERYNEEWRKKHPEACPMEMEKQRTLDLKAIRIGSQSEQIADMVKKSSSMMTGASDGKMDKRMSEGFA